MVPLTKRAIRKQTTNLRIAGFRGQRPLKLAVGQTNANHVELSVGKPVGLEGCVLRLRPDGRLDHSEVGGHCGDVDDVNHSVSVDVDDVALSVYACNYDISE